jgi:hypothetical protein
MGINKGENLGKSTENNVFFISSKDYIGQTISSDHTLNVKSALFHIAQQQKNILQKCPTDGQIINKLEELQKGLSVEWANIIFMTKDTNGNVIWQFNLPEGGLLTIENSNIRTEEKIKYTSYRDAFEHTNLQTLIEIVMKRYTPVENHL